MLAIEGPDGAGKSRLAIDLAEALNVGIYHPGGPAESADAFRIRLTAQERVQGSPVHDRLMAISEPIYARALGRPTYPEVRKLADYYLRNLREPIYLVYCRLGDVNEMFTNIDRTYKEHKSEEHIASMRRNYQSIVDAYDERIVQLSGSEYPMVVPIMYNWYVHNAQDIVERVKEAQ